MIFWQSCSLLHHLLEIQGLLPLLAHSKHCGVSVGDNIGQNSSLLHHRTGLLPSLALLTSTDVGTAGNDIGQDSGLQHHRQTPKACCHCWPFSQALMAAFRKRQRAEPQLLHLRRNCQGLLPFRALLTSADVGTIGKDIGPNCCLLHLLQVRNGLLQHLRRSAFPAVR